MIKKTPPKIIFVDDDTYVLETVAAILTEFGFMVYLFSNGFDAFNKFLAEPVDVVLTDIKMPMMTGIELLEKIHAIDPETPVILTTGYADLNLAVEAIQKGAFDFILKPYNSPYLIHAIEKGVQHKRMKQIEKNYYAELENTVAQRTQELTLSEERYRHLVEASHDWTWEVDAKGTYTYASAQVYNILGYTPAEIFDKRIFDLMSEAESASMKQVFAATSEKLASIDNLENSKRHKDGHMVILETSGVPHLDSQGNLAGYRGRDRDITERKYAEQLINDYQDQLCFMAAEISLVEERERHGIATAIHDQISQTLALAKIKLDSLKAVKRLDGARKEISEIGGLLQSAINHSRSLTFELSPPILYELGLEAAVRSLCENFQKQHGITVSFEDDGSAIPLLEDQRVLMFQAARELLVNVVKHAQASSAGISLGRDGDFIRITVEDNGIGFAGTEKNIRPADNGGFGLFSLRERIKYSGGRFELNSTPGNGSRITLALPLLPLLKGKSRKLQMTLSVVQ
jgi:PAS domain S-box-containing protein